MRNGWRAAGIAVGLSLAAGVAVGAGAGAQPARAQMASNRTAAAAAPEIVLTGRTRENRAAEARLAGFLRAVRRADGERAARYLSRSTALAVRQAVARREWPWRTAPQDLGLLFRLPALRLRTVALRGGRARVRIAPQQEDRKSTAPVGFYDVGMEREGSRWQVRLPAAGARR
jgi:hypothetical protein